MPKGSPELTAARKGEIVDACEKLYQTESFKDITVAMIAERTSFTRASVYNYFKNKEEIFLALMEREYAQWNESLTAILEGPSLDAGGFSEALAASLDAREQLLKLLSMNHYDMEANSRTESLVAFKREYGASIELVRKCLERFFPEMNETDVRDFIYTFFPEMFGVYAYAIVTSEQREAMADAGVGFEFLTSHELIANSVRRLLPSFACHTPSSRSISS